MGAPLTWLQREHCQERQLLQQQAAGCEGGLWRVPVQAPKLLQLRPLAARWGRPILAGRPAPPLPLLLLLQVPHPLHWQALAQRLPQVAVCLV